MQRYDFLEQQIEAREARIDHLTPPSDGLDHGPARDDGCRTSPRSRPSAPDRADHRLGGRPGFHCLSLPLSTIAGPGAQSGQPVQ